MSDLVRVAVDAMGGDYAPVEPVKGAVEAVNADERVKVQLVGQVDVIEKELQKYTYPKERVEIVPATEIIETGEPPVNAIRHKKDSSIVVGMKKVRYGEADAFVSSGSTGAVLVGGQTIVGRIKGVERPPDLSAFPAPFSLSPLHAPVQPNREAFQLPRRTLLPLCQIFSLKSYMFCSPLCCLSISACHFLLLRPFG